jgi:glycosyltransferase 2 family protein
MDEKAPPSPTRRRVTFFLKLVIGIVLLVSLCFWKHTGRDALQLLHGFRWESIIFLFFVGQIQNIISSVKWQLFLNYQGFKISFWRLYGLYLIGRFFSNFLPSMVGGDLTRVFLLGRQIKSQSSSAASVFWERFTGLIAVIVVAVLFSLAYPRIYHEPLVSIGLVASVFGAVVCMVILTHVSLLARVVPLLEVFPKGKRIAAFALKIHGEVAALLGQRQLMTRAMAWSVLYHVMTGVFTYCVCRSIHFNPPFLAILVITPIVVMLNNIPVSPNNLGWWEWTFSIMMTQAGGGTAQGLGVALVIRAISILSSLIGGLLFLFERMHLPSEELKEKEAKP